MDAARPVAGALGQQAGKNIAAYKATGAIAAAYALVCIALWTIARRPGPVIPGISAFFAAGVFVTELATAFLLFVRLRDMRTWSLLLLACAYLYSSLMALPYLLTFPGALLRNASVFGSSQSIAWTFLLWVFGFSSLTLIAALLETRRMPQISTERLSLSIWVAAACVLATVAAVIALAIGAAEWLPLQVGPGGWTRWDEWFSYLNMALLLAGVVVIIGMVRERNEIFLWASLALTAMFFGNVLSTYGGGRFTVGWSFSRVSWVFSGCALFLYFMGQFVRQQRLLSDARAALEQRVGERTAELTSMIGQRDLLLREVHHRVKNNFQVINSLVNFQASHAASPETRQALNHLHGRIYALGLVHQRLMQSSNLATFDIHAFLADLCGNLAVLSSADARGIALTARADPLQTDLDFAGPLGLLVTELVTAAFARFGDGEGGKIEVTIRRGDIGRLALTVQDDARPEDDISESRIVRGLVRQLDGDIVIAQEGGTLATVTLRDPDA